MVTEVADHLVHSGFHGQDAAHRVILDDRLLHSCMLSLVGGAEEMIGNFAINDSTAAVIELGLSTINPRKDQHYAALRTLRHLPSVP